MQLHVLLGCILLGFASIDLCFDSVVLFDYENGDINIIKSYYERTRSTSIVIVIKIMIALMGASILRCVVSRGEKKDYIALFLAVCLVNRFLPSLFKLLLKLFLGSVLSLCHGTCGRQMYIFERASFHSEI